MLRSAIPFRKSVHTHLTSAFLFALITLLAPTLISQAHAQSKNASATEEVPDAAAGLSRSKKAVEVPHTTPDTQISGRLERIFQATGWFTNPVVESREGIVTLKGTVAQKSQREWAENLARDTEGVIAVVNSIEVPAGQWFDVRPVEQETKLLFKKFLSFTPYLLASVLVMIVVVFASIFAMRLGRKTAEKRVRNSLLIEIISKLFALPVVLLGLYLVLRISGLTGIAVTILGGTGAIGLIAGFAMKNILENYFTGVMLSVSNPYSVGDTIRVNGQLGVVQTLTTRGTVLVDFDGNHVIIPNSTIYNTTVINESSNPSTRVKFSIGIAYDVPPAKVRETILSALKEAKDILDKPDSLVMMSGFGASAINYDVYFWIDSRRSSGMKMKSLAMELVRAKLCEARITIPGEVREIVFNNPEVLNNPEVSQNPERFRNSTWGQIRDDAGERTSQAGTHIENRELLNEAEKGRGVNHGDRLI